MRSVKRALLAAVMVLGSLVALPQVANALHPDCEWSRYGCDYAFYADDYNEGYGTVHTSCGGEYGGSYYGAGSCP